MLFKREKNPLQHLPSPGPPVPTYGGPKGSLEARGLWAPESSFIHHEGQRDLSHASYYSDFSTKEASFVLLLL